MRRKISAVILTAIFIMAMSVQAFAAEGYTKNSDDVMFSVTEGTAPATRAQYDYSVTDSVVYPAIVSSSSYYDIGTRATGSGQWCNITLSSEASNKYREKNCDGFYVIANINAGPAKTYKLYLNGELVEQGSVPSQYITLKRLVKNNNPANWRLVLYDLNNKVGMPVWGYIYLN